MARESDAVWRIGAPAKSKISWGEDCACGRISEINRPQGGSQAGDGEMQQNGAFSIAGGGTSGVSSDEDRPDGVQRL